jgi:hypothetical protein
MSPAFQIIKAKKPFITIKHPQLLNKKEKRNISYSSPGCDDIMRLQQQKYNH